MPAPVAELEAEEHALRVRVVYRHPLPRVIRQADEALAALGEIVHHGGVGVSPARGLGLDELGEEAVPHPAGEGPGRVRAAGYAPGTGDGVVAGVDARVAHLMPGAVVIEERGAELEHDVPGLDYAHADGLGRGVAAAGYDRRPGREARFTRGVPGDEARELGYRAAFGELVRPAEERALGLVYAAVGAVKGPEGRLREELVYDVIARQLRGDIRGAGQELRGAGVHLGLAVLNPEYLRRDVVGAYRAAEAFHDALLAVALREPGHLIAAARVYAVEYRLPERAAVFVHREAVAAEDARAHAGYVPVRYPVPGYERAGDGAEIMPPDGLGVVLEEARRGVLHRVRRGLHGCDIEALVHQDALCLEAPDVYAHEILAHGGHLFTGSCGIPSLCS